MDAVRNWCHGLDFGFETIFFGTELNHRPYVPLAK